MTSPAQVETAYAVMPYDWRTPSGQLAVAADGSARATARHLPAKPMPALLDRSDNPLFLNWTTVQMTDAELVLLRPATGETLIPLVQLAAEWRRTPATHLAAALELAEIICRGYRELEYRSTLDAAGTQVLLSEAQVFCCGMAEGRVSWRVLPLPLEQAKLVDYALAAPELVSWLAPETLTGSGSQQLTFLLGAVLHTMLIGELCPVSLPRSERVIRMLSGHAGNAVRTRSVLAGCLPRALNDAGGELAGFITMLLGPPSALTLSTAQIFERLDRFRQRLAAPLLAAAWEAERHLHFALDILAWHARMADPADVPWDRLANLHEATGNHEQSAHLRETHRAPAAEQTESLIGKVSALVASGAEGLSELEQLISRARAAHPEPGRVAAAEGVGGLAAAVAKELSEEDVLYVIYANARWLDHADDSLRWLKREFAVSWSRVVKLVLVARLSASLEAWNKVPGVCREARALIATLPDHGGEKGRYTVGYCDVLDGIAHGKLVEGGLAPAYLADGVLKLGSGLVAVRDLNAGATDPLMAAWLLEMTGKLAEHAELRLAWMGAQAFAQSLGLDALPARDEHAELEVPWFKEDGLFTA